MTIPVNLKLYTSVNSITHYLFMYNIKFNHVSHEVIPADEKQQARMGCCNKDAT
jgi:hypothetical protein